MNINELLRARSFLVLAELKLKSWEKCLPFCWTRMSATGTKRMIQLRPRLSAIGVTADIVRTYRTAHFM